MSAMGEDGFHVRLPVFDGPFSLLAGLVLDQKVDVCDVPVAQITELFLQRGMRAARDGEWSIDEATYFLAICAIFLELKVGRLLPRPVVASEEDLVGGISVDLLYARSIELAAMRAAGSRMTDLMFAAAAMYPREAGPPPELAHLYPDVMARVTPDALRGAAGPLLSRFAEIVDLSHITPIRATLLDAIGTLQQRLSVKPEALLRELMLDCEERIEVVVRFLAILELYREGKVELSQGALFGDIEVRWRAGSSVGPVGSPEVAPPAGGGLPAGAGEPVPSPAQVSPRAPLVGSR